MSVNAKMTAIADAIRRKTGGSGVLTLDGMVEAIDSIQTGGGGGGVQPSPLYLLQAGEAAGPVGSWSTDRDGYHYGTNSYSSITIGAGAISMSTNGNTGYRHGRNTHTDVKIDIEAYRDQGYRMLTVQGTANAFVGIGIAPRFAAESAQIGFPSGNATIWTNMGTAYPGGYAFEFQAFLRGKASVSLDNLIQQAQDAGFSTADCYIVLIQVAEYSRNTSGVYTNIYFE